MVLADDADVVSGVAQLLRVRPRSLGDRDLVGDIPLGVGQHLVLTWALAGEQRGARRRADSGGGEAVGEGESGFAHRIDDWGLRVGVTQAADRVGAMLVGHDDQDVAHVVGNIPRCMGHQLLLLPVAGDKQRTLAHTSLYAHGFAPTEPDKKIKSAPCHQSC